MPSPLSSPLTNSVFDSFHSAHSQLWAPPSSPLCAFPFSHLRLHFHSAPRPPLSVTRPSIRTDTVLLRDAVAAVETEGLWMGVLWLVMLVSRERL